MTPEELAKLTPEELANVSRKLLLDCITNAVDAIKLVDSVSEYMDPADVKAAIATVILRSGLVPTTALSRAWLRNADASKVTH